MTDNTHQKIKTTEQPSMKPEMPTSLEFIIKMKTELASSLLKPATQSMLETLEASRKNGNIAAALMSASGAMKLTLAHTGIKNGQDIYKLVVAFRADDAAAVAKVVCEVAAGAVAGEITRLMFSRTKTLAGKSVGWLAALFVGYGTSKLAGNDWDNIRRDSALGQKTTYTIGSLLGLSVKAQGFDTPLAINDQVLKQSPENVMTMAQAPGTVAEHIDTQSTSQKGIATKSGTIVPGDTLSRIAQKNKLTAAELLTLNANISDPNRIQISETLVLPDASNDIALPQDSNQQAQVHAPGSLVAGCNGGSSSGDPVRLNKDSHSASLLVNSTTETNPMLTNNRSSTTTPKFNFLFLPLFGLSFKTQGFGAPQVNNRSPLIQGHSNQQVQEHTPGGLVIDCDGGSPAGDPVRLNKDNRSASLLVNSTTKMDPMLTDDQGSSNSNPTTPVFNPRLLLKENLPEGLYNQQDGLHQVMEAFPVADFKQTLSSDNYQKALQPLYQHPLAAQRVLI